MLRRYLRPYAVSVLALLGMAALGPAEVWTQRGLAEYADPSE